MLQNPSINLSKPKSQHNMKMTHSKLIGFVTCATLFGLVPLKAGEQPPKIAPENMGKETDKDLPGSLTKYYGQRANLYRDNERKLAKVHLDGDLNYDGCINQDPGDHGAFKRSPPGLIVGKGELSKLVLTITPYKIDYDGRAKVRLEVTGINRNEKTGEFPSWEAEKAGSGHIIVWSDAKRTKKLIDSREENSRSFTWTLDDRAFPYNIQVVPRSVYVEGVNISPKYLGDLRLMLMVFDGKPSDQDGNDRDGKGKADAGGNLFRIFRPSFNDILLTITDKPFEKHFANNNAEGVWIAPIPRGK